MSNSAKKMPVTTEKKGTQHPLSADLWRPLEKLRQQVDHLFDDFNRSPMPSPFGRGLFDVEPFWRRELIGHGTPAVDITEKDKSYEITAELPGMDQKDIEIKLSNGSLIIRGEKQAVKEEKPKATTSANVTTAPSNGRSTCPKGSTPTRSTHASAKAC